VPSASLALTQSIIEAGAVKRLLLTGVLKLSVGGIFEASTVAIMVEELVVSPLLSVAFAVSE
jgi:hypothetical protein